MNNFLIFPFFAFLLSAVAGLFLTFLALSVLARWGVLDDESHRSLHTGTVPRGGGLAIVLGVCLWQLGLLGFANNLGGELLGFWVVTLVAASLGIADDVFDLSVWVRLIVQCLIGAGFYFSSDFSSAEHRSAIALVVVFITLSSINLSNFMDGADGLLGTQAIAIMVCVGIWQGYQGEMPHCIYNMTFAGAILGFLYWNWSPAKIFLGDVGSYFIGATIAMLLLTVEFEARVPLVIILMPLWTDASLTLFRRIINGKEFWAPHREHVYQRLVLQGLSHAQLSVWLLILFVVVFLPISLASLVYSNFADQLLLLFLSATISAGIWVFLDRSTMDS